MPCAQNGNPSHHWLLWHDCSDIKPGIAVIYLYIFNLAYYWRSGGVCNVLSRCTPSVGDAASMAMTAVHGVFAALSARMAQFLSIYPCHQMTDITFFFSFSF